MLLQFRPIGTFKNNFALALMHLHCQFQSLELGNLSIDGSELLKIRKKWKKIPRAQLYKKYPWHYLTINLLHSYIQFVKKIHTLVNLWFGWKIFAFREAEVKNPRIFGWIKKKPWKSHNARSCPGIIFWKMESFIYCQHTVKFSSGNFGQFLRYWGLSMSVTVRKLYFFRFLKKIFPGMVELTFSLWHIIQKLFFLAKVFGVLIY